MLGRRRPVHIGLSARIFHPESGGTGLKTKTLQVLEQSVAQWAASRDTLVLMVPSVLSDGALMRSNIRIRDYADYLDGLLLQGGADVSPRAYGEEPLKPEWGGDPVRDAYELELVHEFMEAGKPILGICRGMQLINVALGGSLYQDLPTQCPDSLGHESQAYDRHAHEITFTPGGKMRDWFGVDGGRVTSIHHQAVNRLGKDVVVEATAPDGVIEAIRWTGRSFVCGVQWHPEFHHLSDDLLDCHPLLEAFLNAAR
ncbi:gamma-glutamyl-gamma-aminobutyrate hydrolase family protein [Tepidicella xavieri]|jgi:putative glutamine amidotransferase|uniref:Putative glutamine amidotransferase n=1 Tax=Tepidicella xavieri TaxID=360241 RepID=A0A4R6UJ82_9BURK|nr:gamma-glutamyl-gamma-aminobutyrate hydrolase family protein [Tepidicella xavieri]TDQ45105.1 putative glutamine amidotransferase [Tepidicella xavieri]